MKFEAVLRARRAVETVEQSPKSGLSLEGRRAHYAATKHAGGGTCNARSCGAGCYEERLADAQIALADVQRLWAKQRGANEDHPQVEQAPRPT